MPFKIETEPMPYEAQPISKGKTGPKPRYPLSAMQAGQWIKVPYNELYMVQGAVRHAKKAGRLFQIQASPCDSAGRTQWLFVLRTH